MALVTAKKILVLPPAAQEEEQNGDVDHIEEDPEVVTGDNDEVQTAEDAQPAVGDLPGNVENTPERESSAASVRSGKLDLEPIDKPKKTNVLKKMNSRGSVLASEPNSKPSSSKSNSSTGSRGKKS